MKVVLVRHVIEDNECEAYMVEEIVKDNDHQTEMAVDKTAKEDDKHVRTMSVIEEDDECEAYMIEEIATDKDPKTRWLRTFCEQ